MVLCRYAAVKKCCYIERPVANQVINVKTISQEKRLMSVAQKVALQINAKLGGELWGCITPFQQMMVVGIDVYHEKGQSSSVAGVVATLNHTFSRYHSQAVFQHKGQELMDALKTAFLEALQKYHEVNGCWPNQIVVFRDGVGDGQQVATEQHEAAQFIDAFKHIRNGNGFSRHASDVTAKSSSSVDEQYAPEFNFVVVQKRINTRILTAKGGTPPGSLRSATVSAKDNLIPVLNSPLSVWQSSSGHGFGPQRDALPLQGLFLGATERQPGYSLPDALCCLGAARRLPSTGIVLGG